LKPNLEASIVDEFITPTKQIEELGIVECVNDQLLIKKKISQVENLITDDNNPKKKVMCGSNAEQLSIVDETLCNFRLIQRNEDIMEVASFYLSTVENTLDISNDTLLLELSPKESNFVFVSSEMMSKYIIDCCDGAILGIDMKYELFSSFGQTLMSAV